MKLRLHMRSRTSATISHGGYRDRLPPIAVIDGLLHFSLIVFALSLADEVTLAP